MDETKALVRSILEHPGDREWSLQGLGMLRTYIEQELRLHVWDPLCQFENASQMHTHPWHFHSLVVAGRIKQFRFTLNDSGIPYNQQRIFCGVGGGLVDGSEEVVLLRGDEEVYEAGATYSQLAHEIHVSMPDEGTVTLIRREFLDDADHALVFWRPGGEWVTAEPRQATADEVKRICDNSLRLWF